MRRSADGGGGDVVGGGIGRGFGDLELVRCGLSDLVRISGSVRFHGSFRPIFQSINVVTIEGVQLRSLYKVVVFWCETVAT